MRCWSYVHALKKIPSMENYKLTGHFKQRWMPVQDVIPDFFFFLMMDFFGHMIKINITKDWSQSIPSKYFTSNVTRRQVLLFIYESTWTWVFSRHCFLCLLLIQEKLCFLFFFSISFAKSSFLNCKTSSKFKKQKQKNSFDM